MISLMNYLNWQDQNVKIIETTEDIPEKDKTFLRCAVVKFFTEKPNPDDNDFHALADSLKISPHELEEVAYELLSGLLKGVGKHKEVPITKFDPEQVKLGLDIEKEHTDSPAIALQITKDHLSEFPKYYSGKDGKTGLVQMEKDLKKE